MKHIHRKFLNQIEITPDLSGKPLHEVIAAQGHTSEQTYFETVPDDFIPFLLSDDAFYSGFEAELEGQKRIIPEPDTLLVYYSTAYWNYKKLNESMQKVIVGTRQAIGGEPAIDELYEYFGLVSCVVIFLAMTVEGTMNRCIPEDFIYQKENSTKTYTKEEIERRFSFDNKLKVINQISNKNFAESFGQTYQHILKLKDFRDSIIHTKSESEGHLAINHNYRRAFVFDFTSAMLAVRDFCNFYLKPNFIVDCPCAKEW